MHTRLVSQMVVETILPESNLSHSQEVDVGLINSLAKGRSPVTQQDFVPIDTIPFDQE